MNEHGKTTDLHAIPGKTYTKVHPSKMTGYEATGEVTTLLYEGGWQECVAEAQRVCALGSNLLQVTANVVGAEAGMSKLTVSMAVFAAESSSSSSDTGSAGTAGDSENNPTYSFEVSGNAVSILLHPKVQEWMKSASDTEKTALQALANGAMPSSWVAIEGGTQTAINKILGGNAEMMNFILRNPPQFYSFSMILRSTFKVNPQDSVGDTAGIGTIQKPKGPYANVKIGKKRDFLYLGASYQTVGNITTCTKSYLLSEEGGWPTEIYGS